MSLSNGEHVLTGTIGVGIVGASIKDVPSFGIAFYDHKSVRAGRARENIVWMDLVIGHKIADFRVVRTHPKIQPIIFVKLVFERETAYRAAKLEQVYGFQVHILRMGKLVIPDQFHKKAGRTLFGSRNIHAIFGPGQCDVKQTALLRKWDAPVLIGHQLHDGVVLQLAWETKLSFKHIDQDDVVISKAFCAMGRHKGELRLWVLRTVHAIARALFKQPRPEKLIHVVVIPADQQNRGMFAKFRKNPADDVGHSASESLHGLVGIVKWVEDDGVLQMLWRNQLFPNLGGIFLHKPAGNVDQFL